MDYTLVADGLAYDDEFDLDVVVVADGPRGRVPCATDDGCAPTCASACNSNPLS